MQQALAQARAQGLALSQYLAICITNGLDWLFRSDQLVKSGKIWFELVYDGSPVPVRYDDLSDEGEIRLVDGSRMPVERKQYPLPLVLVPSLGVAANTFDLMPE